MELNLVTLKLQQVTQFLADYQPLINSHMVSFFTEKLWEKHVPLNIREEMNTLPLNEVLLEFWSANSDSDEHLSGSSVEPVHMKKFINEARSFYLSSFNKCLKLSDLQELLRQWGCVDSGIVLDQSFMSMKKSHEVEAMSNIVSSMCKAWNCQHVVDVGGGKGYLTSVLFLEHNLKVLGLDSSSSNCHVAAKRTEKMQKSWTSIRERIESGVSSRRKGKHWKAKLLLTPGCNAGANDNSFGRIQPQNSKDSSSETSKYPDTDNDHNFKRNIVMNKYFKQSTCFVSSETKLLDIMDESFPDDSGSNCSLIGLHTCGNLASSCLKLFANDVTSRLRFVVNVGCCYHLLTERFPSTPSMKQSKVLHKVDNNHASNDCDRFPLSKYLCNKHYSLSYNSRMLSSQSVERISKESKLPSDMLFYRALFEVLLWRYKYISEEDRTLYCIGRINCSNFTKYVFKAIAKLQLNLKISEEEVNELYEDYLKYKEQLCVYYMMRVTLAPVIEAVILLDRLLYLFESGIEDAYLVRLFNPVTSPRCYAIIALRGKEESSISMKNHAPNPLHCQ